MIKLIKKLRLEHQVPISVAREAINSTKSYEEAKLWIISNFKPQLQCSQKNGLIALHQHLNRWSLVEINTSTDFAARTPLFLELAQRIARDVCHNNPVVFEKEERILHEQITIRNQRVMEGIVEGVVQNQNHEMQNLGLGRYGCLVKVENEHKDSNKLCRLLCRALLVNQPKSQLEFKEMSLLDMDLEEYDKLSLKLKDLKNVEYCRFELGADAI